ncbi:EutN/CcmL family microcompartment protein [Desulfosporosinus youngiae]|uniref:Carbon dioxide concentrating mechanism/carboxysome shell protein n=1 Tax=Desulfosporosinus youngiae DSM 17734 TaxID=768710 RepID=H5XXY2_9FIRM|nr:EutN/CcmL family microcompartment protein [Desulfosporosinus youngiae]EHQ91485.1 carbon dioxide concentrating mechanism/carboxysome shell protein [Desulfosporosinus youngiae DSM 17734]
MKIGKVVNSVWATRKADSLIGVKLMIVQLLDRPDAEEGKLIVAADIIGAGVGEKVLITEGSSARNMDRLNDSPIDSIIIGIIDEEKDKSNGVPNHA